VEGELKSIVPSKRELIVTIETEDDQIIDRKLTIDSHAIVQSEGRSIAVENLKMGCFLKVRVSDDGETVKAMLVDFPDCEHDD